MSNEINVKLFKAKMAEHGDTQQDLAKELNLPQSGISARINGRVPFKKSEMALVRIRYNLSGEDMIRIFFPD